MRLGEIRSREAVLHEYVDGAGTLFGFEAAFGSKPYSSAISNRMVSAVPFVLRVVGVGELDAPAVENCVKVRAEASVAIEVFKPLQLWDQAEESPFRSC